MYGCESWTIKKAESRRIGAFELWCWRRLLRIHWTARSSNQSILKEISPEYSLEGLTLKLKLQYFGHLMQRTYSLEKILMLGKAEGRGEGDNGGWDVWMASLTQWIWVWVSSRRWWWTGKPGVLQSMGLQRVWHNWATELSWTFFSLWLDNVVTWTNSYNWEEPSTLVLTLALMREGCRLLPKSYSWSFINKTGLSLPLHL